MKAKILMMPLAGLILLAACKGSGNYEVDNTSTDSVAVSDMAIADMKPKLVKTADISFKVKNVQQSSQQVTALTNQYKGMVMSHKESSSINNTSDKRISSDSVLRVSAFYTSAQFTVKVPSVKLDEYLDKVAALGVYVTSRSMDIDDRTLDYQSSQLKLNNRKELVSQHKTGKVIIKDPSAVLNLKDDLVDEQIYNQRINDAVKYSVINLSFYQSNSIYKEVIADDDPAAYNLSFFKRLGVAVGYGWHIFIEAIIMLANVWVFVLLAIVAVWFIRRNKQNKLLAASAIKI